MLEQGVSFTRTRSRLTTTILSWIIPDSKLFHVSSWGFGSIAFGLFKKQCSQRLALFFVDSTQHPGRHSLMFPDFLLPATGQNDTDRGSCQDRRDCREIRSEGGTTPWAYTITHLTQLRVTDPATYSSCSRNLGNRRTSTKYFSKSGIP